MKLEEAINWINYHGLDRPPQVKSDSRWQSMVRFIYKYHRELVR
jgi:hypothetical protein